MGGISRHFFSNLLTTESGRRWATTCIFFSFVLQTILKTLTLISLRLSSLSIKTLMDSFLPCGEAPPNREELLHASSNSTFFLNLPVDINAIHSSGGAGLEFAMLSRVFHAEDGKDSTQRIQPRGYLFSIVKYFGPFLLLAAGFFTFGARYFDTHILNLQSPRSGFLPCITVEPSGMNRLIKPSSSLSHNMSDEELFWIASFAPQVKKYPFKRVPKVAFMFLTRGPLPLFPLWEKFFKGNEGLYSIYVHSLPGYEPNYPKESVFYKRQIPSQVAEWGRMSICDAERRLLANALLDLSNEHFVLLSESCIPLYNFTIIYKYLQRSRFSFMGVFDDRGPHGRGRYNLNMAPLISLNQWRKGSQWFEVDRDIAIYIIQDSKYYAKFKEFCRPPCYVDEHYFPTMLHIEKSNLIANISLTFVDWSRGGAHPATFGKEDINEEFMKKKLLSGWECMYNGQHSSLCVLFARKFAPSSLEPLLNLAPAVLGFG